MNDIQKTYIVLFTSEKRLFLLCMSEFTHLHRSETQNRRQYCYSVNQGLHASDYSRTYIEAIII